MYSYIDTLYITACTRPASTVTCISWLSYLLLSYLPWIRSATSLAKKWGMLIESILFFLSSRLVLVWTSPTCGTMGRSCGSTQQRNSWPRGGRRDKDPPLCALVSCEIAISVSPSMPSKLWFSEGMNVSADWWLSRKLVNILTSVVIKICVLLHYHFDIATLNCFLDTAPNIGYHFVTYVYHSW